MTSSSEAVSSNFQLSPEVAVAGIYKYNSGLQHFLLVVFQHFRAPRAGQLY